MSSSSTPSQRLPAMTVPRTAGGSLGSGEYPAAADKIILAIDDSQLIRGVVAASLERVGMSVYTFGSGLAAIKALTEREVPVPDLILLDIGLPGMDGYDVAKVLRSHRDLSHTVIIMLTGREGVWDRVRSKVVGAKDFIKKPFKPAEMTATVLKHLHVPVLGLTDDVES